MKIALRTPSVFQWVAGDFRECGGLWIRLGDAQASRPARCRRRIAPSAAGGLPIRRRL